MELHLHSSQINALVYVTSTLRLYETETLAKVTVINDKTCFSFFNFS